jgi:hypothetical protein
MATQLQMRRGTTSQVAAFTGANGEVVVDTQKKTLFVNDGATAGGFEIARADFSNISGSPSLTVGTFTSTGIDDNAASTAFTLDSSNNAGLGTGSPSSATWNRYLHISGQYPGVVLTSTHSGSDHKYSVGVDDTNFLIRDETGSATALTIDASQNVTIAGDLTGTGDTKFLATGDIGIGPRQGSATNGAVYIGGNTDNPFVSPTAVFTGDQKLGVATSSPLTPLHIAGDATNAFLISPVYQSIGNNLYYNGSAWDAYNHSAAGGVFQIGAGTFALRRSTAADPPVVSYTLYADATGKVGINTTNPTQKMTVAGNTSVTAGHGYLFGDGSCQIYSDQSYIRFRTNSLDRIEINSGGQVTIGSASHADDVLYLQRSGSGKLLRFYQGSTEQGYIGTDNASTSLPSDRDFKKDISDLSLGLNFVSSLKPKTFRYKNSEKDSPLMLGLIAQEVEESLNTEKVAKNSLSLLKHEPNEDKTQSQYWINNESLIPTLIKAIQEQQTLIESLQSEVNALKEA